MIKLTKCHVRGKLYWRLTTYSAGKRKRQFFRHKADADKALADALKQHAAVGKAFDVMSASEKAQVMGTIQDIRDAGYSLATVWETFRTIPNAPKASCSLRKAVDEVLAAKLEANCRPRHIGNLKWYLGKFIQGRESQSVSSIGEKELHDWFTARRETPRSKRGHVSLLSILFDHCWRRRYISENPVKRLDAVHIDRHSPCILTLRQSMKAIVWTKRRRPKLLAWLALALFCGLRPDSEADFICWQDIDLKRKRIVIGRSKVRQVAHRIIDLSFCPPALEWLTLAKQIGSPLPIHFESRRRAIRALRAYLSFKRWPQDVLRHTAASNLLAFHQDAGKVAAFLGNSAGVLLRDYKALIFKEDAEKFMKILPAVKKVKRLKGNFNGVKIGRIRFENVESSVN